MRILQCILMGLAFCSAPSQPQAMEKIISKPVQKQAAPQPVRSKANFEYEVETMTIKTQSGESHDFIVELADTPEKMQYGLMDRKYMDEDKGMLFIFPREAERAFWMRNTYISLDLLYIKTNGTIHHIHHEAIPLDESKLPSNGPVQFVLEINGGRAKALGIKPGDKIHHWIFGNGLAE